MAMQKLMKVGWFGTKGAIVAGAVYVSIDQGIWTDSNHLKLRETMKNIREMIPVDLNVAESLPSAIVDPFNKVQGLIIEYLPKKDDENVNFRSYWNSGVFWTFGTIADFPSKVISLKDSVVGFATSPAPLPSATPAEVAEVAAAAVVAVDEVILESSEPLEAAAVAQENENKE